MADDIVGPMDFGVVWTRQGRMMVGTPWFQEGKTPPRELPHRLTLPAGLWPEYREVFLALGAAMKHAGLIDGGYFLVDEET